MSIFKTFVETYIAIVVAIAALELAVACQSSPSLRANAMHVACRPLIKKRERCSFGSLMVGEISFSNVTRSILLAYKGAFILCTH
jgi:hypothetical protein